jgi:RimJ/RimL family protein N-acetyltransferase
MPFPIITPRLILQPPHPGDGKGLHQAILDSHDELVYWLNWPSKIPSLEEVEIEARSHYAKWFLREDLRFVCREKSSDRIIGRFAFPPSFLNWQIPMVALSYFISKPYQGNGYALEATNALTRYAFTVLKAKRVEIKCDTENTKSLSIPQKLGFTLEARQKGIWPKPNDRELAEIITFCMFDTKELPPLDVQW